MIASHGAVKRSRTARSKTPTFSKRWLRERGVAAHKPIHEFRKEVGSIIGGEDGILAASRSLRHSDIRITSAIYADQK